MNDKIAQDLEDAARRHDSKILCWDVRGKGQSGLVTFKNRKEAAIFHKEIIEGGNNIYEHVPIRDKAIEKEAEKKESL